MKNAIPHPTQAETHTVSLAEKARSAMIRARSSLVMDHPFFGTLALRLRLQEDSSCHDVWTDGKLLGYNPAYAASLPAQKLVGAQAHEILHLAFGHHLRRGERDPAIWNRACDLAINQILVDSGFALPEAFVHDPGYAGMAAHDIYEVLVALQEEANKGAQENRQTSLSGSADDAEAMHFDGGHELNEEQAAMNEGRGEQDEQPDSPDDSASQKGVPSPDADSKGRPEADDRNISYAGEVRDHPDLDGMRNDRERKAMEQEADVALNQAMHSAMNMGSMPAGFVRLLRQEWRLNLDWRELLRRFLENCADNDYSWTTPNRRYLHQDIYLPSRTEARLPHVALAIDSSGSVDEVALAAFCSELSSILEAFDTKLSVLFHDNRVQAEHTFTRMDFPFTLTPEGGGGTDFRPVCAYIEEQCLHPTCLIWFTDMECSQFPEEPDYPVLWVCSRPDATQPPFGELVTLAEELCL